MRQKVLTVFDEFVPAGVTTWTNAQFNPILGSHDQIALHVIADNSPGSGTLDIFVEESGDGRTWIQRNDQRTGGTVSTVGDIHIATTTGAISLMWADPCMTVVPLVATGTTALSMTGTPLLPFVRLRFVVATAGVHVKVHATLRGAR